MKDKNGKVFNAGQVVYYSEMPETGESDSILLVYIDKENDFQLCTKMIAWNAYRDGEHHCWEMIDGDELPLEFALENHEITDLTPDQITVEFLKEHFPIQTGFMDVARHEFKEFWESHNPKFREANALSKHAIERGFYKAWRIQQEKIIELEKKLADAAIPIPTKNDIKDIVLGV